ncbi:hypothetical protein DICVIV_12690 [Dictyocaulus viviparus]|uniref:Reverse transcriptase domain-containing protein n=1 Tax=Dictyocaulus viviparus TaxID=29172 RepID=A0A0D8XCG2_DICVI|nr:hypothetical protein DICVIV_12690 [Dictyocaulus viviparus]
MSQSVGICKHDLKDNEYLERLLVRLNVTKCRWCVAGVKGPACVWAAWVCACGVRLKIECHKVSVYLMDVKIDGCQLYYLRFAEDIAFTTPNIEQSKLYVPALRRQYDTQPYTPNISWAGHVMSN